MINVLLGLLIFIVIMFLAIYYIVILITFFDKKYKTKKDFLLDLIPFGNLIRKSIKIFKGLS